MSKICENDKIFGNTFDNSHENGNTVFHDALFVYNVYSTLGLCEIKKNTAQNADIKFVL